MSDRVKNVWEAALTLDEKEQAELAGLLLGILDPGEENVTQAEIDAAWIKEIEHRIDTYDESRTIPLDEAMKMVKTPPTP